MIVTMLVGLFTSRILIQALGVQDYGIYNVVGGFVAMFAIISGAMTGAISRFITFELGTGNGNKLKKTFGTSIFVLFGISAIVLMVGETVGLWFFYNKLVIPPDRLDAAFWVFQLALVAFVFELMNIPFNASIIAHERMDAYAYISLIGVFSKLIICYAILHSPIDRLIFYSLLLCCVGIIIATINFTYCRINFPECRGFLSFDSKIVKEMFSYAGWSFIGSSGWILRSQGGTILLNLFGGPIVNAANAVAAALSSAVTNFANCITNAFTPQITKSYAGGNFHRLNILLMNGTKVSFFMLLIIALPVILNADFLLKLWLGLVPDHSVIFARLILLMALLEVISVPLITAKNATGNIRNYQIIVGGIQLLAVPLAYGALKLGAVVEILYVAYIFTSFLCLIARLYLLKGDIPNWSLRTFFINVVGRLSLVAILSSIIPYIIMIHLSNEWVRLFATTFSSLICCAICIFYIGFSKSDRQLIIEKIKSFYVKRKTSKQ